MIPGEHHQRMFNSQHNLLSEIYGIHDTIRRYYIYRVNMFSTQDLPFRNSVYSPQKSTSVLRFNRFLAGRQDETDVILRNYVF